VPSSVFQTAPILTDLIAKKLQGKALAAFTFWNRFRQIGMWLALPPHTPDSYVSLYRKAFSKAVADPDLRRLIARYNPDPSALSVEDLAALIREMTNTPDELVAYVDELTKSYR